MTTHADIDALVSITTTFRGDALGSLDHVASCADCRATLADLDALQAAVAPIEPDAEFAARVAHSLDALRARTVAAPATHAPRSLHVDAIALPLAVFVIAALSVWLLLALGSHAVQVGVSTGSSMRTIVVGVVAGGLAALEVMRMQTKAVFGGSKMHAV